MDYMDYMKKAIQLTKDTMTKNTILKFKKSKVGLREVEDIAQSVVNRFKCSDKSREVKYDVIKDLMKHILKDTVKCASSGKRELSISMENLSKVVRKGTLVRNEFMELVDKEVNHIWKERKESSLECSEAYS